MAPPEYDKYDQYLNPAVKAMLIARRLGLDTQEKTSRTRLNTDWATRQQALNLTGERGRRDINEGAASRGLFNSGIRLNELGEFESDLTRQTSEGKLGWERAGQDLASALAAGKLGIEQEEMQAGLEGYNAYLARQVAEQEAAANAAPFGGGGFGGGGESYGGGIGGAPSAAAVSRRVAPPTTVGAGRGMSPAIHRGVTGYGQMPTRPSWAVGRSTGRQKAYGTRRTTGYGGGAKRAY